MWSFYNPVKIHFGWNAVNSIKNFIYPGKALIVTGRSSTRILLKKLLEYLKTTPYVLFDNVEENPSAQTVEAGIELCRRENCSYVIGFGGGSPLDCGKAIAFLADKNVNVLDVMYKRVLVEKTGLPFIAVPTTAGTGSEVTPYSIITDTENKKKISIANINSFPQTAIVDPELTISKPSKITASCGLDVLTHAVESAWSKNSNEISRALSVWAVKLVLENLEKTVKDGTNKSGRENLMLASMIAGVAISGTGTTINHPISYPLTLYKGLAHGFACAISISEIMRYNYPYCREILDQMAFFCGLNSNEQLIERIENLLKNINAPTKLSQMGLGENDLEWLTEESFSKNVERNPAPVDKKILYNLLKKMI